VVGLGGLLEPLALGRQDREAAVLEQSLPTGDVKESFPPLVGLQALPRTTCSNAARSLCVACTTQIERIAPPSLR
jgi:hypothetical protein